MNNRLKNFLFSKHVLVNENNGGSNQVAVIYGLRNKLNIRITDGFNFADDSMIPYCARMLGEYIPDAFYRGFPNSVRELSPSTLLFDQLIHYTETYGFGNFEEAGHSVFEHVLDRSDFSEEDEPKEFRIMLESTARIYLEDMVKELLASSRPLNEEMLHVVLDFMSEYSWRPTSIVSKETAIELLLATKDMYYCKFIQLTDLVKLVDCIQWGNHYSERLNKLRLTNKERVFITKVLDELLKRPTSLKTVQECVEKRDTWKGILHHIHYCPKTEDAKAVISGIYNKDIRSAYSTFEKGMKAQNINRGFVAKALKDSKGNGTLLRNLNYILSTAANGLEVESVLDNVDASNPLVIMQMQDMYRNYNEGERVFRYTRHGRVRTHNEPERKHVLSKDVRDTAVNTLEEKLKASLSGKVCKVYIAPGMENIAVPMNISAGESGLGILPTGSRVKLPEDKKIRAFTYWEKVNDIDLSCFGICEDGRQQEFSWRTMYRHQSDAVTYSGDQTSGYHGGSEYFDIDFDKVAELYPDMKYIVFCNNVYSGMNFSDVVCRAGWMARDVEDSGEVYEPKTVRSAYKINAKSTFCYLYAIDIDKHEVIWLNVADSRNCRVAGRNRMDWLKPYYTATETMNMRKLFEYAGEVVSSPDEAELVVGDITTDKEQVRSYEFEKAFSYLR